MSGRQLTDRVEQRVREWNLTVETTLETESSFLAFGTRGHQAVVLKLLRAPGDEWRVGEILDAFEGRGTVRLYAFSPGAVLLERLSPGTSLVPLVLDGRDEEATEIIADVIQRMTRPREPSVATATVEDWGKGFERYLASRDTQVPIKLVERAQQVYLDLSSSQRRPRLLHGDLQHYNVLFDSDRGWVAIDPKGVAGEVEYEVGASLRNPYERPDILASPQVINNRLRLYAAILKLDVDRAMQWCFAQAVLSAIWTVEDGDRVDATNPSLLLADVLHSVVR